MTDQDRPDSQAEATDEEREKMRERERLREIISKGGKSDLEKYLEEHGLDLFVPIEEEPGA